MSINGLPEHDGLVGAELELRKRLDLLIATEIETEDPEQRARAIEAAQAALRAIECELHSRMEDVRPSEERLRAEAEALAERHGWEPGEHSATTAEREYQAHCAAKGRRGH